MEEQGAFVKPVTPVPVGRGGAGRRRVLPAWCVVLVGLVVAGCGVSQEEIDTIASKIQTHLEAIDLEQFRGVFAIEKLRYVDQRNSTMARNHAISIHLIQNDGERQPNDPGDMPKSRALLQPEAFFRDAFCPPVSLVGEHEDFMVRLSVYSTRFDENYNINCPF